MEIFLAHLPFIVSGGWCSIFTICTLLCPVSILTMMCILWQVGKESENQSRPHVATQWGINLHPDSDFCTREHKQGSEFVDLTGRVASGGGGVKRDSVTTAVPRNSVMCKIPLSNRHPPWCYSPPMPPSSALHRGLTLWVSEFWV